MPHSEQEFIEKRQAPYTQAILDGDLEKMMSYFVDQGLEYTDYGVMELNMDKAALRGFFGGLWEHCGDWECKTLSVEGHKTFTVWEAESKFTVIKESPMMKYQVLQRVTLLTASLQWWDQEGEKIVKEKDYAVWKDPE
ncbi:hypothetical protein BU16DRAFT_579696 [Lophium mytilinum]|uniref:SnoaL-like domain-containing protein n=1 Tax=Lophium mytilinum TaxID=390894 RepID=A0A6A6R1E0_9PEZI|nr:hypothetical protein BU16DRAFT_579696 [Lophium mytilinum]